MNVRAEPLLFLRQDNDMITYTACTSDRAYGVGNYWPITFSRDTIADVEVALRKEVRPVLELLGVQSINQSINHNFIVRLKVDPGSWPT